MVSGSVAFASSLSASPAEYAAEKQGAGCSRRSAQELGQFVASIPITGIGATHAASWGQKHPDEIARLLRALRLSTLYSAAESRIRRCRPVSRKIMRGVEPGAGGQTVRVSAAININLKSTLPDSVIDDPLARRHVQTEPVAEPAALSQQAVRDWSWRKRRKAASVKTSARIREVQVF